MARVYTMNELDERLDLSPAFAGKSDDPVGYVPESDLSYNGSFEAYLKVLKKRGEFSDVFKFCPATSRRTGVASYADLNDFKPTQTGWETSLSEASNAERRDQNQSTREGNLPFIRMYMMGDLGKKIVCPIMGCVIDSWEFAPGILINVWEQHHFKVISRASVQKDNVDPGELLRKLDFSVVCGETVEALKDMMRTIFLSPTAHKGVHNAWNNSDITNYTVDQRPWALQSQANWDAWMDFLAVCGYSGTFFGTWEDWMKSLELTPEELSN